MLVVLRGEGEIMVGQLSLWEQKGESHSVTAEFVGAGACGRCSQPGKLRSRKATTNTRGQLQPQKPAPRGLL